jgi:hypothetical protein
LWLKNIYSLKSNASATKNKQKRARICSKYSCVLCDYNTSNLYSFKSSYCDWKTYTAWKATLRQQKKCKNEQEYARNIYVNCVTIIRVNHIILNNILWLKNIYSLKINALATPRQQKKCKKMQKNRQNIPVFYVTIIRVNHMISNNILWLKTTCCMKSNA